MPESLRDKSETFWGIELSAKKRVETYSLKSLEVSASDPEHYKWKQKLQLKMATLGASVANNQRQVVEVEVVGQAGIPLKVPLVNMMSGHQNTIVIDACFCDTDNVLFRLKSGDGPIYLTGVHFEETADDYSLYSSSSSDDESSSMDSDETDDDDQTDDNEMEDDAKVKEPGKAGGKRTTAKRKSSKSKMHEDDHLGSHEKKEGKGGKKRGTKLQ